LVAGLSINYLWGRFQRDRLPALVAAALALSLAIAWPLLLQPRPDAATPTIATVPFLLPVWPRSGPASELPNSRVDFDLGERGQFRVSDKPGAPPVVQLTFGGSSFKINPLPSIFQASLDGAWATPLNSVSLLFSAPDKAVTWDTGSHRYVQFHYDQVNGLASRFVRLDLPTLLGNSAMCGDLYLNVDPKAGAIDLVALTGLPQALWVRNARFFTLAVAPASGQKLLLQMGSTVPWDSPVAIAGKALPGGGNDLLGWVKMDKESRRFLNLQDDQAVLYQTAGPEMSRPFTELARSPARAPGFADYLVLESADGKLAALIYFPDWNKQALRLVSPAAGQPVQANALTFEPYYASAATGEPDANTKTSGEAGLLLAASVADTTIGGGRSLCGLHESPVVGLGAGTYLNRIAIRIVPAKSDYAKLVKDIVLWTPPPNPKY
jgi:hypothetical protein